MADGVAAAAAAGSLQCYHRRWKLPMILLAATGFTPLAAQDVAESVTTNSAVVVPVLWNDDYIRVY